MRLRDARVPSMICLRERLEGERIDESAFLRYIEEYGGTQGLHNGPQVMSHRCTHPF